MNKRKSKALQKFTDKFIGIYDPFNVVKFQTAQDLFTDLTEKVDQMVYPSIVHGSTTKTSLFYQIIALTILAENNSGEDEIFNRLMDIRLIDLFSHLTELTIDHSSDIALMLSSCKDVESAEIPKQLASIANKLRASGMDKKFSQIDPIYGLDWLRNNCNNAYELLTDFLKKHSHRAYKEVGFFRLKLELVQGFDSCSCCCSLSSNQ